MQNEYSIKGLIPQFGISLSIALICGLGIGYLTPSTINPLITIAASCAISVIITLLIFHHLFLRPAYKSLAIVADCLTSNSMVPKADEEVIYNNPFITPIYKAIREYVNDFYERAKRLGASGNTIAVGSAEVSSFVDGLNGTIQSQANQAIQISSAAEEISQSTSHIADLLTEAVDAAAATHASCVEGEAAVGTAINTIHSVNSQVQNTSKSINQLKNKSEQIQSITEVINSVAEQTNLLALNAAIEAARAGEHGRGFAVVADEVRELANKTASATSDIARMLKEIHAETEVAVGTMEQLVTDVDDVVEKTELIGQTLSTINQQASASENQARDIQEMIREHVLATSEISNSIEHVRTALEQTETEAVTASSQAMKLAAISETIYNDLSMFNLGTIHDEVKKSTKQMALEVQALFENAITNNILPESCFFDQNYQSIPGTDPEKFKTKYDDFCDTHLPSIQERFLNNISGVVYAICIDPNGYVPTHNNTFAKPPVGDYNTDLVHSRSKRLFQDPTGIRCGSHTQEFLLQTYKRDTGEIFHDLSAPIYINGRHWGGARFGYKAEASIM